MRWKEVKEDAAPSNAPSGWAEALEEGLDDVRQGRVVPVSVVIADIDAVLAEMANHDEGGHGEDIPESTDQESNE